MYNPLMKPVIKQAINYRLHSLNTSKGYDGADLLRLSFKDNQEMLEFREYLKLTNVKYVSKLHNKLVELICIYEVPNTVYPLK